MTTYLVTFGTKEFYGSIDKLVDSAEGKFHACIIYTENNIPEEFYTKNKTLFQYKRGYGYWVWKPYIILQAFEHMSHGDMCLYCDSTNIILDSVTPLFQICKQNGGILLFDNRDGEPNNQIWKNYMWTKYDCFHILNCIDEKYIMGNQVDACYQVYEKNDTSIKFLKEYLHFSENINAVSDLPNIFGNNYEGFRDHRHDQSILSLMAIKYNIHIEREPSQWGYHSINNNSLYGVLFNHHRLKL